MIIFTNGCFDILHTGHIDFLKKMDDFRKDLPYPQAVDIIVGINSDESVRRFKGKYRPFFNERDRKTMLEATKYVDRVFIFNEDSAVELIHQLKPEIYFKGWDYSHKAPTSEHRAVESYGGKVLFASPPSNKVRHSSEISNDIYWAEYFRRRNER